MARRMASKKVWVIGCAASSCVLVLGSLGSCRWLWDPAERVLHEMSKEPGLSPLDSPGVEKLARMGERAIDPIVRFYRKHYRYEDPKIWAAMAAAEAIARVRDRRALPKLMELAMEPGPRLSLCAVYAIRAIAAQEDAADVLRLIEDERFVWQPRLIEILGSLGGEEAREVLLRYVRDGRAPFRRGAFLGLKAMGDASLLPQIRQAFETETNPRLRVAAAEALASLGDEAGGAYLAALLEGETPGHVLEAAAYACARVREKRAVPGLIRLLSHKDWWFRHLGCQALMIIGTEEALGAIEQVLPEEERKIELLWPEVRILSTPQRDKLMDWDWGHED